MPDIFGFIAICGIAAVFVYMLHFLRDAREELGVARRIEALEKIVFGTSRTPGEAVKQVAVQVAEKPIPKPSRRKAPPTH